MSDTLKKQNVICPFCGKAIPPESRYCIYCGRDLSEAINLKTADSFYDPDCTVSFCRSCGADSPLVASYCINCGANLKTPNPLVPPLIIPPDEIPSEVRKEEDENLRMQIRMLEGAYIRTHGLEAGSPGADRLFPMTWFSSCSMTHIEALAEAIKKKILIRDTETWNKKMIEGVRLSSDRDIGTSLAQKRDFIMKDDEENQ